MTPSGVVLLGRIAGIVIGASALLLSACDAVAPLAADGDGAGPRMPECQVDGLVFAGETTLAAIGLAQEGGPDAHHVGKIWFTTSAVNQVIEGPAGPEMLPVGHVVCAQWDEQGSSMMMTVDESWDPPVIPDAEAEGGVPLSLLAVAMVVLVVGGVSWRAFRGDGVDASAV